MSPHPARNVDPALARHLDVQNGDVRFEFLDGEDSLLAILRFGDDVDPPGSLEQLTNPGANDGMIVGQDDTNGQGLFHDHLAGYVRSAEAAVAGTSIAARK